tara:strand:+ start:147 stop:401 length:255 start_codon:yes stop_codon:yes gene_type:complete
MKKLLLSFLLIVTFFFGGLKSINAAIPGWTPPENYRKDDSLEMVVEPPDNNENIAPPEDNLSVEDPFGSEQVFPFEPGLGNSAF